MKDIKYKGLIIRLKKNLNNNLSFIIIDISQGIDTIPLYFSFESYNKKSEAIEEAKDWIDNYKQF